MKCYSTLTRHLIELLEDDPLQESLPRRLHFYTNITSIGWQEVMTWNKIQITPARLAALDLLSDIDAPKQLSININNNKNYLQQLWAKQE